MSLDALRWALALERPDPSWGRTHKAVLECLADHANVAGEAFVSIALICAEKWMDRKAVIKALADLRETGLIVDTGKRRGRTGQVVVWSLPLVDHRHKECRNGDTYAEPDPMASPTPAETLQAQGLQAVGGENEQYRNRNSTGTGTVAQRVPVSDAKGTGLGRKEYRFGDTEPPTGYNPLPGDNPLPGADARARTPARKDENTKNAKPDRKPDKGKRLVPEDFQPRPADTEWAQRRAPRIAADPQRMATETERFLNHHLASGNRFRDPYRAWRNWILKSQEFAERDRGREPQASARPEYLP